MKKHAHPPLRYQVSEWDCVPTCFINALTLLLPRSKIPPDLVREIYSLSLNRSESTLDAQKTSWLGSVAKFGKPRPGFGTSQNAVLDIVKFIGKHHWREIGAEFLEKESVTTDLIADSISAGRLVLTRVVKDHYVLVTGVDNQWVYLFDPLFGKTLRNSSENIERTDLPNANFRARHDWFSDEKPTRQLCLGPVEEREAVIICKTKKSRQSLSVKSRTRSK